MDSKRETKVSSIPKVDLVQEAMEKVKLIKERIRTAQSRQKSYADKRRKDLEFEAGDEVFLRLSPRKGVVRFGKKGKLRPRYIGPFEILDRIGDVAYRLALPPNLQARHNVFHISMLRKYIADPSHIINHEELDVSNNLAYEESPVAILGNKVHKLRNREVPLVLVQWSRHGREEATWEREEEIIAKYPMKF
ncbi:hypothetical protein DH2020_044246 [Rehmannia glutinosa]|uniref:Tf2-1-like SH3-like domain-containing protein n=1 Tax=Rehmannia glutinosa TaxID=99300 RepID=A0ABR0UHG1_REHGL